MTEGSAIPNGTNSHSSTYYPSLKFETIPTCIEAFAAGEFLIVLDSPSRENEGDLIIAAKHLTPSKTAFMIRHTSGYLCAPMTSRRAKQLDLPPMVPLAHNADPRRTNYTVSVDAVGHGITTGISSEDRSTTANVLASPEATTQDLHRPGHLIPLIARDGGVQERNGHTEAAVDLARLAGIEPPVSVIGEMVVDGEPEVGGTAGYIGSGMMRAPDCLEFGKRWAIKCCTIEDLIAYVEEKEGKLKA